MAQVAIQRGIKELRFAALDQEHAVRGIIAFRKYHMPRGKIEPLRGKRQEPHLLAHQIGEQVGAFKRLKFAGEIRLDRCRGLLVRLCGAAVGDPTLRQLDVEVEMLRMPDAIIKEDDRGLGHLFG